MIQCPLPKFDFDRIHLGHGSGGKLTAKLLDAGVFSVFQNSFLQKRDDAAVCPPISGELVVSTDSYVVSPYFFAGGDIGKLAVHGTLNDLAMCGGIPKYLTLGLIIEEDFPIADFQKILQSIAESCDAAGVPVITGDTKVVEKGKGDGIFINTTGIGEKNPHANLGMDKISVGDRILISGSVGLHGATILGHREGFEFSGNIQSDTRALHVPVHEMIEKFGSAIRFLRDPTRGGVSGATNETAETSQKGIRLFKEQIPIPEEVEDFSALLGLDPLYIANEGIFIACVADEIAEELPKFLQSYKGCENAALIGRVTEESPGKVILENELGGTRLLNLLPGEQLPRIC